MFRLVKLMKPATNTNSINATIRTRCFSAKATTAFMPGSVGPGGAILDHAVAGLSGADLAQSQGIAVARYPDASLLPFVDDRLLRNCRRRRCLPGDNAEIRE